MICVEFFAHIYTKFIFMKQYLVYAWDGTDGNTLERRMSMRPSHFENAKRLKALGNFILGGAILNDEGKMIGSNMIMQFETEAELQDWLNTEPYITKKVWENFEVHPFKVADV
jgi:uncharacterized protein YciI